MSPKQLKPKMNNNSIVFMLFDKYHDFESRDNKIH